VLNWEKTTVRALKLICCLCFLLIAAALLLIDHSSPATGYELSIYESVPSLVWVCLTSAIAGGTGVVVHQAFRGQESKYWLLGFLVLMLSVSVILLLPAVRDYYLYAGEDTVAHVRWTEGILREHHFEQDNNYPVTHTLMAQFAAVAAVSPVVIVKYISVIFTLLFMLFSYLLAVSVFAQKSHALLVAACTALFFNYYHVCAYPQTLSVMTLPLVFYLYFKGFGEGSAPFRVAFIVVLLLIPYFHPAPAAVLIACLLAAETVKAAWRVRRGRTPSPMSNLEDRISFGPTLICAVTFLTWISSFYIWRKTIYNALNWLVGEFQSIPRVAEVEQLFETQGLGFQQQVALGLKLYGDNLIYLLLASGALLLIIWRYLRGDQRVRNLSILSAGFLVSGPVWVLIFATTLLVTLGRLLSANIMMWATPVLGAFALYTMFGRWKRAGVLVVTSILLLASVIGLFGVYHSPWILQPSWQVTRYDVQGTGWFLDHTELEKRDVYATLGIPRVAPGGLLRIPDHFGYSTQETLGQSLQADAFLLVGERFRVGSVHPVLSETMVTNPSLARRGFSQADFEQLAQDDSVSRVYANGELDIFFVTQEVERDESRAGR
jgi:hypothetical protein